MKGALEFKGLTEWLEDLAAAGRDVDEAVADSLNEISPFLKEQIHTNLLATKQSDEVWTGETESSLQISDVKREGNYIYIEASIGGGAVFKEYGTTRQAAEPFFRAKTFRSHRIRNRLKENMKRINESFGLKV